VSPSCSSPTSRQKRRGADSGGRVVDGSDCEASCEPVSRARLRRMLGPSLETPRLILRPPTGADFDAFAAFAADPSASTFLGGVQSRAVAWRGWAQIAGSWLLNGYSMFSYIEKASGRWIGRGGPWMPEGWPGTEVGWGIVPDMQRKGYAKEAATASIDWAFDALGWTDVIHCIDPRNAASIAVAKSLGSKLLKSGVAATAPLVGTWDLYGQTRDEWRSRQR
jgi:RimJ/RimL family protein N-acetyltransferase